MAEEEPTNGYCSSSGEGDRDTASRAAIDPVAGTSSCITFFMNGHSATKIGDTKKHNNDDRGHNPKTQKIKHYQIKAQKALNDILENTIEIVKKHIVVLDEDPEIKEWEFVCLNILNQPGIVFDHIANDAYKKSLARLEVKDAAAKAATKKEEERVEKLKKIRRERWPLPSGYHALNLDASFMGILDGENC